MSTGRKQDLSKKDTRGNFGNRAESERIVKVAEFLDWMKKRVQAETPALAKKKKKQKPEASIQEAIIKFLCAQGCLVVHVNSSVIAPNVGSARRVASDVAHTCFGKHAAGSVIVAYQSGKTLFFEVKTDNGRMSERQEKFREAMLRHGIAYHLARSVEDVQKVLSETP